MADIIENNFSMETTPLVDSNEPVVEQPLTDTTSEGGDPIKKGATSITKDKTPKYSVDDGQLNTVANETTTKLAEFAGMVFKTTGVAPTYKGKAITDLSSIASILNDGKAGQEIYKQALAALESPDLDEDSLASFYTKVFEIESGYNRTAAIKQQINKNKRIATNALAAKTKDNSYNFILNKDGDQVPEDDFILNTINDNIDKYNEAVETARLSGFGKKWKETLQKNAISSIYSKIKGASGSSMSYSSVSDIPENKWVDGYKNKANPYGVIMIGNGKHHQQVSSKDMEKQFNDNIADGGYEEKVTKADFKKHRNYNFYKQKYATLGDKIKEEYNSNPEIPNIKVLEEGVFKEGSSDATTSLSSSFSFDADDFLNRDDKGEIVKSEDAGSTDKKASMFKPEFANLFNLVRKTKDMEGAIIVSGSPEDYPSGVPDKTDDKVKGSLVQFNTDLKSHIATFLQHSKKLTPTKLKGRPAGSLNFQPIASGNENYQAYHITFAQGYAEKYAGSEKKQKEHPEYKKGITIFIPKEKAGETRIGAASLRGTHISNTEAAINMSADNTYRFNIPGGGNIEASKIGDSAYTVTGNFVNYNRRNGKYDTIPLNPKKYEIGSSMALDMDGHIKEAVDSLISNLVKNRAIKNYHNSQQGVTDPNLLKRN